MDGATYLLALGSNRRSRAGSPERTIAAALDRVGGVLAVSPVLATPPLGPSGRRFANAVALVGSDEPPPAMLARLQRIERAMGRRGGRRWGARTIDLDILAWSGGRFRSRRLTVPHPRLPERAFVLAPLAAVAPRWPIAGARTARHLAHCLARRAPRG